MNNIAPCEYLRVFQMAVRKILIDFTRIKIFIVLTKIAKRWVEINKPIALAEWGWLYNDKNTKVCCSSVTHDASEANYTPS